MEILKKLHMIKPNYNLIFIDIIKIKFPEKQCLLKYLLENKELTTFDILEINRKLFSDSAIDSTSINPKFKSYHKTDILKILEYQKINKINNTELATQFNISRNTISKWRKLFIIK